MQVIPEPSSDKQQLGTLHGAQHSAGRCTDLLKFKLAAGACCDHQLPTVLSLGSDLGGSVREVYILARLAAENTSRTPDACLPPIAR